MPQGNWSETQRETIWNNYKMIIQCSGHLAGSYYNPGTPDLLPCPLCFKAMDKRNKYGKNGNRSSKAWNIDHANGNPKCNELKNLQPAHYKCNCLKANRTMHEWMIIKAVDKAMEKLKKGRYLQELEDEIMAINLRFKLKPEGEYIWS